MFRRLGVQSTAIIAMIFACTTQTACAGTPSSSEQTLASNLAADTVSVQQYASIVPSVYNQLMATLGAVNWTQVLYSTSTTDTTVTAERATVTSIIENMLSFKSSTTTASAETMIENLNMNLQFLNSSVSLNDTVAFLNTMVPSSSEITQSPLVGILINSSNYSNPSSMTSALKSYVASALASAPQSIQSAFQNVGTSTGAGGGGSAGSGGGSGATGTGSSGGTGSGTSGSGAGTGSTGGKSGGTSNGGTPKFPPMSASERAIYVPGEKIAIVPGLVHDKTTYMPIFYVSQMLKSLGYNYSWDGKTWTIVTPPYTSVDLSKIKPQSGNLHITINGHLITSVNGIEAVDPFSRNKTKTTYMPIYYVMKALDRLKFTSDWDGKHWTLTPATESTPRSHGL